MIKIICGEIGSTKTLNAVRDIIKTKHKCYTNFNVYSNNVERLKISHLINKEIVSYKRDGTPNYKTSVNWDFWNSVKNDGFSIYFDEFHNVANSRRSSSSWNVNLMTWITQIRKILSDNELYHLVLVTQKYGSIDVAMRTLAQSICHVSIFKDTSKTYNTWVREGNGWIKKPLPYIYSFKKYFTGSRCESNFYAFYDGGVESWDYETCVFLNPFIKYYSTDELIEFGKEVYV